MDTVFRCKQLARQQMDTTTINMVKRQNSPASVTNIEASLAKISRWASPQTKADVAVIRFYISIQVARQIDKINVAKKQELLIEFSLRPLTREALIAALDLHRAPSEIRTEALEIFDRNRS
jgi:hypothetical protein